MNQGGGGGKSNNSTGIIAGVVVGAAALVGAVAFIMFRCSGRSSRTRNPLGNRQKVAVASATAYPAMEMNKPRPAFQPPPFNANFRQQEYDVI